MQGPPVDRCRIGRADVLAEQSSDRRRRRNTRWNDPHVKKMVRGRIEQKRALRHRGTFDQMNHSGEPYRFGRRLSHILAVIAIKADDRSNPDNPQTHENDHGDATDQFQAQH